MSQSDFLIRPAYGNTGNNYTGSAILNSTLSNPLTSSDNCRVLNEENGSSGASIRGIYLVTSSLSGGMFVNIDETKSVSLRMWGRISNYGDGLGFALLAKHNGYNTAKYEGNDGGEQNYNAYPRSGYEFGYDGTGGDNNVYGRLYHKFGDYKTDNSYSDTTNGSTALNYDIWIGLRMDITPVRINRIINGTPVSGTFKDIVRFYTASYQTPDTWVQIGNDRELLADGNDFVPWGAYTPIGAAPVAGTPVATSSYGFLVKCTKYNTYRTYFDDFQIIVEDAY